jgi:hypothetical protein
MEGVDALELPRSNICVCSNILYGASSAMLCKVGFSRYTEHALEGIDKEDSNKAKGPS